jgi:carotenoid 1,2-hydratase
MTERGRKAVHRDSANLSIGPSALSWEGDELVIQLDEITAPFPPMPELPRPVRGEVRLRPRAMNTRAFTLDEAGGHVWHPLAPRADVSVNLVEPGLSWSGEGYLDHNRGNEPLEQAFEHWDWSRVHLSSDSAVLYDLMRRDGSAVSLAMRFGPDAVPEPFDPPAIVRLPNTGWGMKRFTRSEPGGMAGVTETWENTPFYSRSALRTRLLNDDAHGVHESLSLGRLRSPIVRTMLPFRMPRSLR